MKAGDNTSNNSELASAAKSPMQPTENGDLIQAKDLSPEQWLDMFETLNNTLQQVNSNLQVLEGKHQDSDSLTASVANRINSLEEVVRNNGIQQRIMINIMIKQDETIQVLKTELAEIKKKKLNKNMIIEGLLEDQRESKEALCQKVKSFFESTMEIPEEERSTWEIIEAYHKGKKGKFE